MQYYVTEPSNDHEIKIVDSVAIIVPTNPCNQDCEALS